MKFQLLKKIIIYLISINNKIVIKLNNNTLAEKIKTQALRKIVRKIDAYIIKNNITTIKVCKIYFLPTRNIAIQIINKEKAKKLKKENI